MEFLGHSEGGSPLNQAPGQPEAHFLGTASPGILPTDVHGACCHLQDPSTDAMFDGSLWVTRKGATSARKNQLGIIPGDCRNCTAVVGSTLTYVISNALAYLYISTPEVTDHCIASWQLLGIPDCASDVIKHVDSDSSRHRECRLTFECVLQKGSMGVGSYITRGKGNAGSWNSCSHGAGRRMSRTKARKEILQVRQARHSYIPWQS